MKNLVGILLVLIISGCAVNNSEQVLEKRQNEEVEVVKDLNIKKVLEKNNEVKITVKTIESKSCSIFLNKRVIELNKLVDKEFVKIIKLKKEEEIEDVLVKCD